MAGGWPVARSTWNLLESFGTFHRVLPLWPEGIVKVLTERGGATQTPTNSQQGEILKLESVRKCMTSEKIYTMACCFHHSLTCLWSLLACKMWSKDSNFSFSAPRFTRSLSSEWNAMIKTFTVGKPSKTFINFLSNGLPSGLKTVGAQ